MNTSTNNASPGPSVSPFPIDLVYLWVDDSDPEWLAKKNAALAAIGKPVNSSDLQNRFESKGELQFALRSVQNFLPWINHVYIITNNQIPSWLNTDNPRVSIVDHRDIIPAEYLPAFNSEAIQLFAHRIPGLSEHFILSSDDMFVGSPLKPDFFFNASGDPIVIVQEHWYPENLFSTDTRQSAGPYRLFDVMLKNAIRLAFDLSGQRCYFYMCHVLVPFRKSHFEDIFARHGAKIIPNTTTTFREEKNIERFFYPLYNHVLGRTDLRAEWRLGTTLIPLSAGASWLGMKWRAVLKRLPFWTRFNYVDVTEKIFDTVSRFQPALFNVNTSGVFAENIADMEKLFPQKSEFEK